MIEHVHDFGAVDGAHVLGATQRLSVSIPTVELRWAEPVQDGWLYRKKFPRRTELVFGTLETFVAIAEHGGELATVVDRFPELDGRLDLGCTCVLENQRFKLTIKRSSGRWFVAYSNSGFDEPEARSFLTKLLNELDIPIRMPGDKIWSIEHALALELEATALPQRVGWEVRTREEALRFVSDFNRVVNDSPRGFAWSGAPAKDVPPAIVPELYDMLLERELPVASTTLNYEFSLPKLDSILELQGLCQKSKDEFTLQLARFRAEPGVTVEVSDKITKKGHQLSVSIYDEASTLSKSAVKELLASLLPVLDVKL